MDGRALEIHKGHWAHRISFVYLPNQRTVYGDEDMRKWVLAATACVASCLLLAAPQAHANEANVEQMLKDDPVLAAMDVGLNKAYLAQRDSRDAAGKEELLERQRRWLARRNKCADADCVKDAYARRLVALSRGIFGGWQGTFESDGGLTLNVASRPGGFTVGLEGAGANFTCDGSFDATAQRGVMSFTGYTSDGSLYRAGTGVVLVAPAGDLGACGARAPQQTGYYARQ